MAKKYELPRTFNIAVVGLSGTEKEKGVTGVGKSCLCNRFVRPLADDYHVDHISVLSQTDFSGRVVNNDHFLYWGEVTKTSDEGAEFVFQVIEHTEFIDDSSFQTFKSGKHDPYYKRVTNTKLGSAEKLMYICKNQLGIEKEYEQKLLPDGKFNVDGFVCTFDVSDVQGRSIEKQVEFTVLLLSHLLKTKKPVVLATTKHEEARDLYVREAEKLLTRKEIRGTSIPLIETSAHENINVELAFVAVAQLIDRAKGRSKIVPFYESARARKEVLDVATDAYQSLIRSQVTDYRAIWSSVNMKFSQNQDFLHYCEQFGQDAARNMFKRHVKKLKEEYIGRKMQMYIRVLPEVLGELLPDLASIGDGDWTNVRERLKQHPDFHQYFLESPDEQRWQESDLVDSNETRIPFDILDTPEAENCFEEHRAALDADEQRQELRQEFKELLEETGLVTPGKLLSEVRVLFLGRECCERLSEQDLKEIYQDHQREITERAKHNFQELLLEQAELFYYFASIGPGNVLTQEDFNKITEALQEDSRYKALDRLGQDRMLMILQHLGFVHGPIREHCPANPNCMDTVVDKIIAQKAHRNSQWLLETENNQLNLVLLGSGGLAERLANAIKAQCVDNTFEVEKVHYTLDFRIIDGDVGLPQNSFRTTNFRPHGCFCVYANPQTLEYIRESLEKTLLSNLEQEDRLPFHGLPIVILFAADATINEKDLMFLREEGQNRAKNLQCPFIDVSSAYEDNSEQNHHGETEIQRFEFNSLNQALRSLIESIQRRAGLLQIYHQLPDHAINPDIRILMCMLCGDPYQVEHVLGPLLSHQCCFVTAPHSVTLETYLGDSKRSVEVRVTSFHGANAFRDELVHGFILVYSTKRKASLATLGAFSNNIPNIPIQILAVSETDSAKDFFSSELSHQLITEGNAIADKLQAHFMTSTASMQQKTAFYTPFFKEVWERKPQIEKAFHMEDSDYSVDSQRTPVPPPVPSRQESYHIRSGSLEDGGDSEGLYEQLPTDSDGSTGAPLSPSDDSDLYASVFHPGDHLQENGGDHLVKPSRVKNRRSLQAGWAENRIFERDYRSRTEEWLDNEVYHTYHSERQKTAPPTRPKPNNKPKPGKLNLKQFENLTDAINRLSTNNSSTGTRQGKHSHQVGATLAKMTGLSNAPLATPESIDLGTDYAHVKDAVQVYGGNPGDYSYSLVHNALSQESKPHRVRSLARRQGNREAFDKAKMKVEQTLQCKPPTEEETCLITNVGKAGDQQPATDKAGKKKEDRKKIRDDEKQEKRRQKEEERIKRQTEKKKKKTGNNATQGKGGPGAQPLQGMEDFVQSDQVATPLFVEKCIVFIEEEGLDSEGIYRVPGNRAHVDLLFQKFDEDPRVSIRELDIPVNAVATALKDFFSKRLPPLLPAAVMDELTDIAGIQDKSCRLFALRDLLKKLPDVNFQILKYVFQHFVKVAENCRLNSMDSKNLAICWWPTLLPLEFNDMLMFERMRPHLEDSVQTMIDQFRFLFCDQEEVVMMVQRKELKIEKGKV